MTFSVLILAGSRDGERDPLARLGNVSHKALLPINGIPMLERVLQTLEQIPAIKDIWVSIEQPECLAYLEPRIRILKAEPSPSESVAAALEKIGTPCLITTADHALLRPEWVEEFVAKSRATQSDLTAGIAAEETIGRDVPNTKRTYIRLSDISFSGCNLFWVGTPKAKAVVALWRKLQQHRKKPLRMAMILGLPTILRAVIRRLSSHGVEKRIEAITKARVRLITLSHGLAAVDVDKPADYELVTKILQTNS